MAYLNREGRYRALYTNLETAQTAREDVDRGMAAMCSALGRSARLYLQDGRLADWYRDGGAEVPADERLLRLLESWAAADPRPAVLLLDEVDALVGDTLVSLLRQLRAGYTQRPDHFPQTVVLCGVRDLRDYRIHARSEASPITGGSAFNIKAESLRLSDFNALETAALLAEHTKETGQPFTPEALERVWDLTRGQSWLVNALAFLQRVVNGDGTLEREYAIGAGRMDLCLRYGPLTLGMELKVWRDGAPDPLTEGPEQIDGYLAGLGLDTGWLVIFDRRSGQPPIAERTNSREVTSPAGRRIQVVRA